VAENGEACSLRDELWADYERRLRDRTTYTLLDIQAWLATHGVNVGTASVHRDRVPFEKRDKELAAASEGLKSFLADTDGLTEDDLVDAMRKRVGQIYFQSLREQPDSPFGDLKPGELMRLLEGVSEFAKARAAVDYTAQRTAELRKRLEAAVAAKVAAAPDGRMSREEVVTLLNEYMLNG
jgi:hypothetical protein